MTWKIHVQIDVGRGERGGRERDGERSCMFTPRSSWCGCDCDLHASFKLPSQVCTDLNC